MATSCSFRAELKTASGQISVRWNAEGQLSEIQLQSIKNPGKTTGKGRKAPNTRVSLEGNASELPESVVDFTRQLWAFLHKGEPMPNLSWDDIDQSRWTNFQKQVYQIITQIPHGETRTYGWVARQLSRAAASRAAPRTIPRAIGQALRRNPLPIIIPCHRVVASDSTGGFMGASDPNDPKIKLKLKLIELENTHRNPTFSFWAKPRD